MMARGKNQRSFSVSLLLFFFLIVSARFTVSAEARPIQILNEQRYSKIMGALGVVCKCCDGVESGVGECRSTWESSCQKLQCLPWKFH